MKYKLLFFFMIASYSSLTVSKTQSSKHILNKYYAGYGTYNPKSQTATICSKFENVEDMPTEDTDSYKTPDQVQDSSKPVICARSQDGQTTYIGKPSQIVLTSIPKAISGQSVVDAYSAGSGIYYSKNQTVDVCSKYTYVQKHNSSALTAKGYTMPPKFVICGRSINGESTYIGIPVKGALYAGTNMKRAKARM